MNIASDIFKALEREQDKQIRHYVGASNIGRECERAIYYEYHNAPSLDFDPKTKIAFEVGKRLEGYILDLIEKAGYTIIRPKTSNKMLEYKDPINDLWQGHADAILMMDNRQYILEVKTAKSSRFQTFVKQGLRKYSETYYAQLQSYMGMSRIDRSVLIAMNKDTHELHCQWVDFDPAYYQELLDKSLRVVKAPSPPSRINNSPFYETCRRCNFVDTCFFDGSAKSKRMVDDKTHVEDDELDF